MKSHVRQTWVPGDAGARWGRGGQQAPRVALGTEASGGGVDVVECGRWGSPRAHPRSTSLSWSQTECLLAKSWPRPREWGPWPLGVSLLQLRGPGDGVAKVPSSLRDLTGLENGGVVLAAGGEPRRRAAMAARSGELRLDVRDECAVATVLVNAPDKAADVVLAFCAGRQHTGLASQRRVLCHPLLLSRARLSGLLHGLWLNGRAVSLTLARLEPLARSTRCARQLPWCLANRSGRPHGGLRGLQLMPWRHPLRELGCQTALASRRLRKPSTNPKPWNNIGKGLNNNPEPRDFLKVHRDQKCNTARRQTDATVNAHGIKSARHARETRDAKQMRVYATQMENWLCVEPMPFHRHRTCRKLKERGKRHHLLAPHVDLPYVHRRSCTGAGSPAESAPGLVAATIPFGSQALPEIQSFGALHRALVPARFPRFFQSPRLFYMASVLVHPSALSGLVSCSPRLTCSLAAKTCRSTSSRRDDNCFTCECNLSRSRAFLLKSCSAWCLRRQYRPPFF